MISSVQRKKRKVDEHPRGAVHTAAAQDTWITQGSHVDI